MYCIVHRRILDYQEVLDALKAKGIAIRVASPKLVMEEVKCVFVCLKIFWCTCLVFNFILG